MHKAKVIILMLIGMLLFNNGCNSQDANNEKKLQNREAVVAGRFYEASPQKLKADLNSMFANAVPKKYDNVCAVIAPHAGYVFSGEVAASGFNQVERDRKYKNVFVLASSHHVTFNGASIYSVGHYETPLGTVKVNLPLAKKLIEEHDFFTFRPDAHAFEHSLEVQLPFLQHILGDDFQIVPIVIAVQRKSICEDIAGALKPYFGDENLFVISTDFSHFPDYEDAQIVDHLTADAIITKDPEKLDKTLASNESRNIPNLATSLCGWSSVVTLLHIVKDEPGIELHKVEYKNSGDAKYYGDKDRVVGYYSIVATHKKKLNKSPYSLSEGDKEDLLRIARNTIEEYILHDRKPEIDANELSANCKRQVGAFVTLNKDGKLRGCIGRFTVNEPLYEVVQQMAIAAATQDYRFPRVSSGEIGELEIEISVLTPMKKIESVDEIELGRHGIYIKKGNSTGTFLPQVATQTGWTKEEFLGHCSKDKARIGWDGWKDAEVYTYEALVFSESEILRD